MAAAKMSVAELEDFLRAEFPQAFGNGDTSIERADGETCLLRQRYQRTECCAPAARCRGRR